MGRTRWWKLWSFAVALTWIGAIGVPRAHAAAVICKHKKKLVLREGSCKSGEQALSIAGASVDVVSLPKVPAAAQADSAGTATTAGSADSADSADTADSLGDFTASEFSPPLRWAFVTSAGVIAASSDSDVTVVQETTTGITVLDFGDDVPGNGLVATLSGGASNRGMIQASVCGGPDGGAQTTNCNIDGPDNVPSEVAIVTLDTSGVLADRAFYVAVLPAPHTESASLRRLGPFGPSPLLVDDATPMAR
jgi:hypothetical protein